MTTWPIQAQADIFYGNPRGPSGKASLKWEKLNLVTIKPPFKMYFAGNEVKNFKIHHKCAPSLLRVLQAIWQSSGQDQAKVDTWGVSIFGGSYNFRLMRGSNHLSMHAYGCAIDLAPERFPMGESAPQFCDEVCGAFAAEGWVNLPKDRMHFQAAIVK